ncbi:MAG: ACP S-malonyltransferase [Betaproteobacteria bacterium]|nr:MAG: ACP S-malonyltransferase [Betaproteobacteria bacterium]
MKLAFVFPGQGSQSVGMMAGFADVKPVRDTFSEASELLGEDLWSMVENGPAEVLNQTTNTQPLMLVAGIAVFRAWIDAGGQGPDLLAGHSLGEYSALVAADAMNFSDTVPLVRFRAQSMQDAVPAGTGAMAAVLGLDDDGVLAACDEASEGAEIAEAANFNAPGQVVVAGQKAAVERAVEAAKSRGARRAMLLPMSAPSHCTLMKPAAELLANELGKVQIQMPKVPVIHNESVSVANNTDELRQALVRQVFKPVRWAETIAKLNESGVTHIVECGPGKVLAGLNKRIGGDAQTIALVDANTLNETVSALRGDQ